VRRRTGQCAAVDVRVDVNYIDLRNIIDVTPTAMVGNGDDSS
jgi:hypothetical protein